ncbi:hypothetical protein [Methanoregula formicica]|uniref:hypothetical protein n=1 Tax=Methanoregula formicica TaxID=882104 RepID=UPI00130ED49B|nr:hypothetical protein [Methanoregula formicica]
MRADPEAEPADTGHAQLLLDLLVVPVAGRRIEPGLAEYYLTDDGRELWDAIIPLLQWTMKREEGFVHEKCSAHCHKRAGHR